METPEVQFATSEGDVRIAYQRAGSGPVVLYTPPFFNHLEVMWEQPLIARVYETIAEHATLIIAENRGTGLSDGFDKEPSVSARAADLKAVADAEGIDRLSFIGNFAAAQACTAFAASHSDRVDKLVLANARVGRKMKEDADRLKQDAPGPYAYGTRSQSEMIETAKRLGTELSDDDLEKLALASPSALDHPEYLRWLPRFQRMWGPRDMVRRQAESIAVLESSEIAQTVETPTLLTHTADNGIIHVGYGRLLAQLMPNATLNEYPGRDHYYWLGENWQQIVLDQIRFIVDDDVQEAVRREFSVVLFTDIVDSTGASREAGDAQWRVRLDQHDSAARRIVERNRGRLVKHTGDGLLASFDTPSAGLASALDLQRELGALGIPIRAGLHAGEVEIRGEDVSGAVVNLASRVEQAAQPGTTLTTSSVRDMLIGSSFGFVSVGRHQLRGFEGDWELFEVRPG